MHQHELHAPALNVFNHLQLNDPTLDCSLQACARKGAPLVKADCVCVIGTYEGAQREVNRLGELSSNTTRPLVNAGGAGIMPEMCVTCRRIPAGTAVPGTLFIKFDPGARNRWLP